jgi:hypothetical protein
MDALDLLCDEGDRWTTENGEGIELDSTIGIADDDIAELVATSPKSAGGTAMIGRMAARKPNRTRTQPTVPKA